MQANTEHEDSGSNSTNAKSPKISRIVIPYEIFKIAIQALDFPKVDSMYYKSKFVQLNDSTVQVSNENNEATIRNHEVHTVKDDGDHGGQDYVGKSKEYAAENKQHEKKEFGNISAGSHSEVEVNEEILEKCYWCNNHIKISKLNDHTGNCLSAEVSCSVCSTKMRRFQLRNHEMMCATVINSSKKGCDINPKMSEMIPFKKCQWCSEYANSDDCKDYLILCNDCNEKFMCYDYKSHLKTCCKDKINDDTARKDAEKSVCQLECDACLQSFNKKEFEEHFQVCSGLITCKACGHPVLRSAYHKHKEACKPADSRKTGMNFEKNDENKEKLCPNCNTNIPRKFIQSHLLRCVRERKTYPIRNTEIPGITFAARQKICNPQQTASEEKKIYEDKNNQKEFEAEVENAAEVFPCMTCDKKFSSKQLTDHTIGCSKRLVKCTECGNQMKSSDLNDHTLLGCSKNMKYDANKVSKRLMEQGAVPKNKYNIEKIEKQENKSIIKRNDAVTSSNISEANFVSKEMSRKPNDPLNGKIYIPSLDDAKKHSKKPKENTNNEHSKRQLQAVDSSSVQSSQIVASGTQVAEKYEGSCNKPIGRQAQTCFFCKKDFATHQDIVDHYETCDFRMSRCMYCGDEVQEIQIASHQAACAKKAAQFPSIYGDGAFNAPKQEPNIDVSSTSASKQEPNNDVIMVDCPTCPKKCTLAEIQSHATACKIQQSAQRSNNNRVPDSSNQFSNPGSYAGENFAKIMEDIPALCPLCNNQYPYTIIIHHGIDCIKKFIQSLELHCVICEEKYHITDIDGHISHCRKKKLFMLNCLTCGKQLSAHESAQHFTDCETDSDEMKFVCCICKEEIEVSLLQPHIDYCLQRNKLQAKLTCVLCSQKFKTDVICDHTMKCCHDTVTSIKVTCPICEEQVLTSQFEDHMPCQSKKCCPWCEIKYPDSEFIDHVEQCDKKQIECIICNKAILYSERKTHQQTCSPIESASSVYKTKREDFLNNSINNRGIEKAKEATELLQYEQLRCLSCDSTISSFEVKEHLKVCGVSTTYENLLTRQLVERCPECNEIFPISGLLHHTSTCSAKSHKQEVDSDNSSILAYSTEKPVIVTAEDAIKLVDCRLIKCLSCHVAFSKFKAEQHAKVCVSTSYEVVYLHEKEDQCFNCKEMIPKSLIFDHQRACFKNEIVPGDISQKYTAHNSKSMNNQRCSDCGDIITNFKIHPTICRKVPCVFCAKKYNTSFIKDHEEHCPEQQKIIDNVGVIQQSPDNSYSQNDMKTCSSCEGSTPKNYKDCGHDHNRETKLNCEETKFNGQAVPEIYINQPSNTYTIPCEYCELPIFVGKYHEHRNGCKKSKKTCPDCSHTFPIAGFRDHVLFCLTDQQIQKKYWFRGNPSINVNEVYSCTYCHRSLPLIKLIGHQKKCGAQEVKCCHCSKEVLLSIYYIHMHNCFYFKQAFQNADAHQSNNNDGIMTTIKNFASKALGWTGGKSDAISSSNTVYQNVHQPEPKDDGTSTEECLPCEFCERMIPINELIVHMTGCQPEKTSYAPTNDDLQEIYFTLPNTNDVENIQNRMENLSIDEIQHNQALMRNNNLVNNQLQSSGVPDPREKTDYDSTDSDNNKIQQTVEYPKQNTYNSDPSYQSLPKQNDRRNFGMYAHAACESEIDSDSKSKPSLDIYTTSNDSQKTKNGKNSKVRVNYSEYESKNQFSVLGDCSEETTILQNKPKTQELKKTPEFSSTVHKFNKNTKKSGKKKNSSKNKNPWK